MTGGIVIVGASLAGLRTAEALRRVGVGDEITVLGAEQHPPYNRPPLSKGILIGTERIDSLFFPLRSVVDDIGWRLSSAVIACDMNSRVVTTADGDRVEFDVLVAATGLRARRQYTRPTGRQFTIRTLEDAERLRPALVPGARLVILGNGFIGCEVAASAAALGCRVTLVGRTELPMQKVLGTQLAAVFRDRHESNGVSFVSGGISCVSETDAVRVTLVGGRFLEADVVVEAVGSLPNTEWLTGTGVDLSHGIRADGALRMLTGSGQVVPDAYAVGDVVSFPSALDAGRHRRVEHWNMPSETARRAAAVIAADPPDREVMAAEPFTPVPSFWTDQFDIHLLSYGLPALGDECRLLEGEPTADCVYGYYRAGKLVGVCGIGMRSKVIALRAEIVSADERTGTA